MHAQTIPAIWHDVIDSTNAEAGRLVQSGQVTSCWIMAHAQTEGRGRAQRFWASPRGNFMGTRLWQIGSDLSVVSLLSLAVGLCVREVLASHVGEPDALKTKWPNDVYLGLQKMCGILIETHKARGGEYWAAIGIGINLNVAPDFSETRVAAKLSSTDDVLEPEHIRLLLEEKIAAILAEWPPSAPTAFTDLWAEHAFGIGGDVMLSNGNTGVFLGISDDGAARVRLDSGDETVVHAGDLVFKQLQEAGHAAGD